MPEHPAAGVLTRRRLATTLAVLGSLVAVVPAGQAAPHDGRSACNLVTDPAGDTSTTTVAGQQVDEDATNLDIVSGDVGMNRKHLTAIIRLADLTKDAPSPVNGRLYEFHFSVADKSFTLRAALVPGGEDYDYQAFISDQPFSDSSLNEGGRPRNMNGIGSLVGIVDPPAREVRISAPVALFRKYVDIDRTSLTHLAATTYKVQGYKPESTPQLTEGSLGGGSQVDKAVSKKEYRPYAPSCAAGRL